MTLVVRGTDPDIEQAGKQLYKLMEVLKVIDLTDQPVVAHEMAIVKVAAKAQQRQEVLLIAQMFNARVLDASPNTIMIEATGTVEQIPDRGEFTPRNRQTKEDRDLEVFAVKVRISNPDGQIRAGMSANMRVAR